jgi:hypothetical protein
LNSRIHLDEFLKREMRFIRFVLLGCYAEKLNTDSLETSVWSHNTKEQICTFTVLRKSQRKHRIPSHNLAHEMTNASPVIIALGTLHVVVAAVVIKVGSAAEVVDDEDVSEVRPEPEVCLGIDIIAGTHESGRC